MGSVWSAGVNLLTAWYLLRAGMSVLPDSIQMWLSVGRRAQLLWRGQWLKSCRTSEPRASDPDCRIAMEVARKTLGKQMTFRSPRLSPKIACKLKPARFTSTFTLLFSCCFSVLLTFMCHAARRIQISVSQVVFFCFCRLISGDKASWIIAQLSGWL